MKQNTKSSTQKPKNSNKAANPSVQSVKRGTKKVQIKTAVKNAAQYAYLAKNVLDVKRDFASGHVTDHTLAKADKLLSKINDPRAKRISNAISQNNPQLRIAIHAVNKSQQGYIKDSAPKGKKSSSFDQGVVRATKRFAGQVNDGTVGGQTASTIIKGTGTVYSGVRFAMKHRPTGIKTRIKRSTKATAQKNLHAARNAALYMWEIRQGKLTIASIKSVAIGLAVARAASLATLKPKLPNPHLIKKGANAGVSAMSRLAGSDDTMLQGIGMAAQAANVGVKTGSTVIKGTATAVKSGVQTGVRTSVKTAKTVKKTVSYARKNGIAKTAKKAISKAGGSIVSALMDAVKALGSKVLVPLCLIVAAVAALNSVLIAPVGAVGAIFGGIFSDKDKKKEVNVAEYVEKVVAGYTNDEGDAVKGLRQEYIEDRVEDINDKIKEGYNYVAFRRADQKGNIAHSEHYNRNGAEETVAPDPTFYPFYSVEEIRNVIQPFFNVIIFQKYEMEPTESQARSTVKKIFDDLFVIETIEDDTKYCNEPDSWCGMRHAITSSCYDYTTEYHNNEYICNECDKYVCWGHTTNAYRCNGYLYETRCCAGHYIPGAGKYNVHTRSGAKTMTRAELDAFLGDMEGNALHPGDSSYNLCGEYYPITETRYCEGVDDCPHGGTITSTTVYHGDANHRFAYQDSVVCDNSTLECSGHNKCNGHAFYVASISMDGVSGLMKKYFTNDIARLTAKTDRTEDEDEELNTLKDNYDILVELVSMQGELFGAMTAKELKKVQFTDECKTTSRSGVLNYAVSGIGNVGGEPYWTACGYAKHTDWNTCFVYAAMQNGNVTEYTGIEGLDGKSDISEVLTKLQSDPHYRGSGYGTHAKQGDIAIMSGKIGIFVGADKDGNIYVVEGDNGDVCRCVRYASDYITGYFVIN